MFIFISNHNHLLVESITILMAKTANVIIRFDSCLNDIFLRVPRHELRIPQVHDEALN